MLIKPSPCGLRGGTECSCWQQHTDTMRGIHQVCAALMALFCTRTVHVSSTPSPVMENCIKINAFSCLTASGLVIDLSPLDSMDYLQPAFRDVPAVGNSTDKFSWNPVTPFCEYHCENAAVCQVVSVADGLYYDTGKHNNARFSLNYTHGELNVAGLVLVYEDDQGGVPRTSILHLLCDENSVNDVLKPYGETSLHSIHYFFEVVSRHACPKNVSVPSAEQSSPVLPTCPHPWLSTPSTPSTPQYTTTTESASTPTETTATTENSTATSEVMSTTSSATSNMTTPNMTTSNTTISNMTTSFMTTSALTTALPPGESLMTIWIVLSVAIVVLVGVAMYVIVLTVNLVKGRTGTRMIPLSNCHTCCKKDTEDMQNIV